MPGSSQGSERDVDEMHPSLQGDAVGVDETQTPEDMPDSELGSEHGEDVVLITGETKENLGSKKGSTITKKFNKLLALLTDPKGKYFLGTIKEGMLAGLFAELQFAPDSIELRVCMGVFSLIEAGSALREVTEIRNIIAKREHTYRPTGAEAVQILQHLTNIGSQVAGGYGAGLIGTGLAGKFGTASVPQHNFAVAFATQTANAFVKYQWNPTSESAVDLLDNAAKLAAVIAGLEYDQSWALLGGTVAAGTKAMMNARMLGSELNKAYGGLGLPKTAWDKVPSLFKSVAEGKPVHDGDRGVGDNFEQEDVSSLPEGLDVV